MEPKQILSQKDDTKLRDKYTNVEFTAKEIRLVMIKTHLIGNDGFEFAERFELSTNKE